MKILFITRSMESGGAERQLAALAKGLKKRGHDVLVAEFYSGGLLEKDLVEGGIRLFQLNKRGRWSNVIFFLRLARLFIREQPDIIHSYLTVPNLFAVLLSRLSPKSKVVLGIRFANCDLSSMDWLTRFLYKIECLISKNADLIIANSDAAKSFAVLNGFSENLIRVISNGIDTLHFKPNRSEGLMVRRKWKIPDGSPLIGLVGRVDPLKDHVTFLHAIYHMSKIRQDIYFVCVGRSGPDSCKLKKIAEELGIDDRLIWAGERSDLVSVYNSFDLLCLSSKSESFPNVICEAMSCGVPCVATNVGAASYIIGKPANIVQPQDPTALSNALLKAIEENLVLPDHVSRQRIDELFGIERLINNSEDLFVRLIKE